MAASVLLAVDGCTIQDTMHQGQCSIISGKSTKVKAGGKAVLLDGTKVQVSGGTEPGPQTAPVTVTLNAKQIKQLKIEGKCPLGMSEQSSGQEKGSYQVGDKTQTLPIVLVIADAGQQKVKGA